MAEEQNRRSGQRLQHLLARCALRDRAAFVELYHATSANLNGVALRILRNGQWAEEVLQDVYVRIWQHAGDYAASRGAAMTWMINIVRNAALDLVRRADYRAHVDPEPLDEQWPDHAPGPADAALLSDELTRLRRCLEHLSDDQRATLLLVHHSGYTPSEVAKQRQLPLGTVKTWVRRGLISLRECLRA
jgi:RNA polymerase sigma-70 factor (ECF subfamily)